MRKQLGILASLVFLSATALFWTGCSGSSRCNDDSCYTEQACAEPCKPVCAEPAKPVCPPPCRPVCAPHHEEEHECCGPDMMGQPMMEQPMMGAPRPCQPMCPPPCAPAPERCAPKPACAPAPERCAPKPMCAPEPCRPACVPAPERCAPKPACAPAPCKPACESYCPPKCAAPLKPCKYGPSGHCGCNGVTVRARNPKMCMLGDQYPLEFDISACEDVCEVTITTTLPEGVSYIRSQPEAKVDGNKLIWEIGHVSKGQTIPAKVWLKCDREGALCTCFCVKATPVAFCALLCAKPVLVCEKCGPEEVGPGEPINYTVNVTNIGTCTAEDVVVTDMLPEGVEHASCQRTLTFRLGSLEPCQTKKVSFSVIPCKRGKICNTAVVTACNANQTSCEACTCVACCALECSKVGPKEVVVGQNADYQVTVVNTGDKVLHEVVVTDNAPSATTIVNAPGANISGKQAIWRLRELKTGEKVTFNLTLTTCTPGYFNNTVSVATCEGCSGCCEAGTNWRGRPALEVCVTNSDNPICVSETTRLKITVMNKGQESDSNVATVVTVPAELEVVNTSGATAAKVNGQTVEFAPYPSLSPRQTLEYYITVKGVQAGDARVNTDVHSDFIQKPITQQESVIVN